MFVESLSWFYLTATFESQEELCSDSVERIVVNPNAAYDKFKDKHVNTKGLGQYDLQTHSLVCAFFWWSCITVAKIKVGYFQFCPKQFYINP